MTRPDPWARLEAWRYTQGTSKAGNVKRMLPGLAIGTGAFVVAVAIETIMSKKGDASH